MLEKSVFKKYLSLLLLCLCSIFLLSHAKVLDKCKPLRGEEQDLALKEKEVEVDSWSEEDSAENIFDGIRFKLKSFASNLRLRTQNTIKYFSKKPPTSYPTMLHRNSTGGLVKAPFKRLKTRLKERRKNRDQNHVLSMEPANTETIYEPIRVMDTGLAIIGTAVDSLLMFGNITNSSNKNSTSSINMTNLSLK